MAGLQDRELEQDRGAPLTVILANPRGFCAGVERAIEIVERALAIHGAPVYVRHEIVHNARVCDALRAKGAVFVEELDEIPPHSVVIFSAHGVPRRVENAAAEAGHDVIDATCPLVAKVHSGARRYAADGRQVILIGHRGHAEVEGTLGQVDAPVLTVASVAEVEALSLPSETPVAYVTQTTLSVSDTRDIITAIEARFTDCIGPDTRDICYATHNRQQAVRGIAGEVDLFLIIGAPNSSNSNRLVEIAAGEGVPAHLVPAAEALDPHWLEGVDRIGISAGASAPEVIVEETIARLAMFREVVVETRAGAREDIVFKLPRELEKPAIVRHMQRAAS
ncbi:MAG: 4-hydroxy-3-methylbut-2-enyl diphosphate reductase [Pseudomonadota bacterium]